MSYRGRERRRRDEYYSPERDYRGRNDCGRRERSYDRSDRDWLGRASCERHDTSRDRTSPRRRERYTERDNRRGRGYDDSSNQRQRSSSPQRQPVGQDGTNPSVSATPRKELFTLLNEMEKYRDSLTACVQLFPHLWNRRDPSFRDIIKREKAWMDISLMLGIPDSAKKCKKYWNYLRTKYVTAIRQRPECIPDDFKLFMDKNMSFLKSIYQNNTTPVDDPTEAVNAGNMRAAIMASIISSALRVQNQSASSDRPGPSTSTPNRSQYRPSTIDSAAHSAPAEASSPASAVAPAQASAAPSTSFAEPRTLLDRQRGPPYIDSDSSTEDEDQDPDEPEKAQKDIFATNDPVANRVLSNAVCANIGKFSPGIKRSILREILRVDLEFRIDYLFQLPLPRRTNNK